MWLSKTYQCLLFLNIYLFFSDAEENKFRKYSRSDSSPTNYTYRTEWLRTRIDHYNFVNFHEFELRYLINDDHWDPQSGAPIFFYPGSRADIEILAQRMGFIWETAPEFNALIVFAEHRYYGKSWPYGDESLKNRGLYGYLTIEQVLADCADLIEHIRDEQLKKYPNSKRSPVIAIGGFYAGELAAFLRMKYPVAVIGALASSAPMHNYPGLTDCNSLYNYTTSIYQKIDSNCPNNIKKIWGEINTLSKTEQGRASLSSTLSLCKPLKHEGDGRELKSRLRYGLVGLAMVNYPYPFDVLESLPANPLKVFCDNLSSENLEGEELINSVSSGLKALFNYTKTTPCIEVPYNLRASSLRSWQIQKCLEIVQPICAKGGEYDMFEPFSWNLEDYEYNCEFYYGVKPKVHFMNQFGDDHLGYARNTIYSNGLLDPWASRGILKDLNPSVIAVVMEDAASELDLRASNPSDPESVVNARNTYKKVFNQWITQFRGFFP